MGQISIGKPIDTSLIRCCSCHRGYEIRGNIYENNILICPHCKLTHKIDFKLIDKKIENLKKIDKLNLTAIDIGSAATDRDSSALLDVTRINKGVTATGTGTITSIEIWANVNLVDCKVAIFYVVSGDNLTARDVVTIGNVTAGSKQTFTEDSGSNPISLDVVAGDVIGIYAGTAGRIELSTSGGAGVWYKYGDQTACENTEFTVEADDILSVCGTGATADFVYAGTGSVAYSGTATAYIDTRHYLYVTSGNFVFSGAGTYVLGFSYVAGGSFAFSGTATQSYGYNFNTVGTGTFNFSGTAVYGEGGWFYSGWFEYGWFYGVGVTADFLYEGTGILTYSGTAVKSYTFNYSCVGSSHITFSGIGTYTIGFSRVGSGTLSFSGVATYVLEFSYTGSGIFTYSGNAQCSYDVEIPPESFIYAGQGEFVYSGIATQTYTRNYLYLGSGEFLYSGSAVVEKFHFIYVGNGILLYLGEANVITHYNWIKVNKEKDNWIKVNKETSAWIKVNKETSAWIKVNKE